MAAADRDHLKRDRELSSPTGVSPPQSRPRLVSSDLTEQLIEALSDARVIHSLTVTLVQPLLDQLKVKDDQIDSLTREVTTLKEDVTTLKNTVDELEQYGRRNAVRIWSKNMPETPGENTDEIVKAYTVRAGVDLPPDCISRSHRVGRPVAGKVRPIIVKFTSYNFRKMVYDSRKAVPDVFVSEDLTRVRSSVLFKARQERQCGRFKHCWSTDGRINIRLNNDSKHVITTQAELDRLIDDNPIPQQA